MRLSLLILLASTLPAQVTYNRLLDALKEQHNWLTYWGDYSAIRHRELKQIDTANVKDMRVEWIFQTGQASVAQTMPLVVDGIMYFTAGDGRAYAIDARSGRQLWMYKHVFPEGHRSSGNNRGMAVLGQNVYMVTVDGTVVALDTRSGRVAWKAEMIERYIAGGYYATLAPLAVKDKIIVGISGGEEGTRDYIDAYDAVTGKRAWRFWTIPGPGEFGHETWKGDSWKAGGGPAWMTGTFDPKLNTLYWTVGNPGPDLYGEDRTGDNLFSCSLLALDPDTGKRKWHFQFTPHDLHDWDANETPMLLDLNWRGKPRKLVVQANRNAFFYVLDRVTGEFLLGKPFAKQTWAKGLDAKGRPIVLPDSVPTPEGTRVCPSLAGAANWPAPSYNPQTGWFYFPVRESCDIYYSAPPKLVEGKQYWGSVSRGATDEKEYGLIKALDPLTGETKWDFRVYRGPWAGTLSTAGGLLFAGDEDGYLMAFDARTGKNLWKLNTGTRIASSPITYMIDGRQFVTIPSGSSILTFALPEP